MSVNKLNLQIGGSREPEEDTLLEETGVSFDVDNLLEELVQENQEEIVEEHGDFLVRVLEEQFPPEETVIVNETAFMETLSEAVGTPIPKAPEPELNRQERMAESLSLYNKKTRQNLTEVEEVSDSQRIKLLEDAFAQMRRAQPATLVSGIGASLDSGGGAVWLWDLDDVSIGTPMNGVYPSIVDGSFLAYNAADKLWEAVEDSGAANILSGGVIKATGGAANSGGNLVIEATDATNGNFTIKNASDVETFNIDGSSGSTTFKGGQVIIERAPTLSSCFQIKGRTVNFPQDTNSILFGNIQYSNGSDAMQYYGLTVNDNDVANKKYVDDSIAGLDPSGGFTFKGTCNVTIATTSSSQPTTIGTPAAGDFYINTTAGTAFNASSPTASNSWIGIAGLTIAADQLIIYSGSSNRWFAGSVEGANPAVLKAGDTMTGPLTIKPDSGTNALLIKNVNNDTTAQIFSGGSASFLGTLTAYNTNTNNLKPRQDDTWSLGDSSLSWRVGYINTINTTAVVNSGTLDVSGSTNLGTATAGTKIVLGNSNMVSSTSNPSYLLQGGKSAILTIGRCTDNSMTTPQLVIQGKTTANDGVKTNDLLQVFRISGDNPDAIRYFGRTSSGNDIQIKSSCDSTYARLAVSNNFTNTQLIKVAPTQFALHVQTTGSTVDTIRLMGDGEIQCTKLTQTSTNNLNTFAGTTVTNGTFNTFGDVTFAHSGSASSTDWKIQGKTVDNPSVDTGLLLSVYRPSSNSPDAISYNGTTSGDAYIQTRASVQALIDADNTNWIACPLGSDMSGGAAAYYRIRGNGKWCDFSMHAAKNGQSVKIGDELFVLPVEALPSTPLIITFLAKNAFIDWTQGTMGMVGININTGVGIMVNNDRNGYNNSAPSSSNTSGAQDYYYLGGWPIN